MIKFDEYKTIVTNYMDKYKNSGICFRLNNDNQRVFHQDIFDEIYNNIINQYYYDYFDFVYDWVNNSKLVIYKNDYWFGFNNNQEFIGVVSSDIELLTDCLGFKDNCFHNGKTLFLYYGEDLDTQSIYYFNDSIDKIYNKTRMYNVINEFKNYDVVDAQKYYKHTYNAAIVRSTDNIIEEHYDEEFDIERLNYLISGIETYSPSGIYNNTHERGLELVNHIYNIANNTNDYYIKKPKLTRDLGIDLKLTDIKSRKQIIVQCKNKESKLTEYEFDSEFFKIEKDPNLIYMVVCPSGFSSTVWKKTAIYNNKKIYPEIFLVDCTQ